MKDVVRARHSGLDLLKIIATVMVVVLHVNGYLIDTISLTNFTFGTNIVWHIFEAIAYPAIHIFVMITAWFAIDSKFSVKGILSAWCQMWFICLVGLIFAIIFRYNFGLKELFMVIFPFTGRAYWFVTDYILLMLISPVLNITICQFSNEQLVKTTALLFIVESIYACFLSTFNWNQDYSNIGLFILLYYLTAVLKKSINDIYQISGGIIWIVSLGLLFGSYALLHYLALEKNSVFMDKEMFFYKYDSPFVIFEALGLMIIFSKINITFRQKNINRIIRAFVNASLTIYLAHMHPIIKEHYVSTGVLSWINIKDLKYYFIEISFCVCVILWGGVILSIPITRLSRFLCCKIENKIKIFNEK